MSGVYSPIYLSSKWLRMGSTPVYLCFRPLAIQPIFFMALSTGSDDWQELFTKIGIPADSARTCAETFEQESIIKDSLSMINREVLKELGVTTMRHALAILKLAKEQPLTSDSYTMALAVKLLQIHSEMTLQKFQKFRIDCEVFVRMTNMPPVQTNVQLYNCADEAVQTSIINTYPNFYLKNQEGSHVSREVIWFLHLPYVSSQVCPLTIKWCLENRFVDILVILGKCL